MAKKQKEKSVTKDRLVGMKVINGNGKFVGTVKNVGFTVGRQSIYLTVEYASGETQDVPWENIQGAGDVILLKPSQDTATTPATASPIQTQPAQQGQPTCPTCKGPLSFIQQYQKWYCYKCQKYA